MSHMDAPPDLPFLEQWAAEYESKHHPEASRPPVKEAVEVGVGIADTALGKTEAIIESAAKWFGVEAAKIEEGGPLFELMAMWEVTKSSFELGTWIREQIDAPAEEREKQREDFRTYMVQNFFYTPEANQAAAQAREAAFDRMVGHGEHGVIPNLSIEAQRKEMEMVHQTSDRWLSYLQQEQVLVEMVRVGVTNPDSPNGPHGGFGYLPDGTAFGPPNGFGSVEDCGKYMTEIRTNMANDLDAIRAFNTDPANWQLTPDQQAVADHKAQGVPGFGHHPHAVNPPPGFGQ